MNDIERTKLTEYEDCQYSYKSASVIARCENVGHGCLFGVDFPPKTSVIGMCWSGDESLPNLHDTLIALDKLLTDFNCSYQIIKRNNDIRSISRD